MDLYRVAKALIPCMVLAALVTMVMLISPSHKPTEGRFAPSPKPANTMPVCATEDGAGQALCTWDATTQGNGRGTSIISGDCAPNYVGEANMGACRQAHTDGQDGPDRVQECNNKFIEQQLFLELQECYSKN